jgi:hypothetical protein
LWSNNYNVFDPSSVFSFQLGDFGNEAFYVLPHPVTAKIQAFFLTQLPERKETARDLTMRQMVTLKQFAKIPKYPVNEAPNLLPQSQMNLWIPFMSLSSMKDV